MIKWFRKVFGRHIAFHFYYYEKDSELAMAQTIGFFENIRVRLKKDLFNRVSRDNVILMIKTVDYDLRPGHYRSLPGVLTVLILNQEWPFLLFKKATPSMDYKR